MTSTSIPSVTPDDFLKRLQSDPIATAVDFYAARLPFNDKAVAFINSVGVHSMLADRSEASLSNHLGSEASASDDLGEHVDKLTLEQARQHKIGFSDRRLGKNLPSNDSEAGRKIRALLQQVGLLKPTGHEALRGCITIPCYDNAGNITGILGRRIDRKAKAADIVIGNVGVRSVLAAPEAKLPPGNNPGSEASKSDDLGEYVDHLTIEANQITFIRDDRRYRIRGLERNNNPMTLKVNLLASRDELVHLDTIDLMKSRSRSSFIKSTAAELYVDADIIKRDIGQLLLKLESIRDENLTAATTQPKPIELTAKERDDALALLRSPNLLDRIVTDMDACGMVGESTNKLVGYLAATSRKLKTPLAIVIQSSSSAGKTSLMDAILDMMPGEDINRLSGLTGRSLYYLHSDDIRHKILAICEDQGIREAAYALKILQSDGELRQLTTERGR